MTLRLVTSIALFFLLYILEASFLSAWPVPWRFLPLVFASAVYVIQHFGSRVGVGWLVGYGLFLDLWQLGVIPGETAILLFVGVGAWIVSRRVFTNRSLYGVAACALASWTAWHLLTILGLAMINRKNLEAVPWLVYRDVLLWQGLLLFGLITIFFFLSGRIRRALRPILFNPSTHETL